ncbi:MAG: helix-turn-helix domain-containing protein, partial [Actinobacteria bacterium]|nr:helix-turn-helix domain-containing protein [Actinomycetota bacterium]
MPTGQLLRLYRIDRKKSTTSVATHAGITVRYLEMLEAGTKTPSLPVLRKLAKVLGVRTSALIGEAPSEDHEGPVNPRLAEVEQALFTYRSLTPPGAEPPELWELAQRVEAAWDAWFTSPNKYSDVLRVLPDLIVSSERAVHGHERSPEVCRLACEVYQLARPVLKHLGRVDLGGLLADRCMRFAEETEDPLVLAAATWNLGQALYADDKPTAALDVAMRGAENLQHLLPDGTPAHFAAYGGLQQVAAISAVQLGDPWRGRELLRRPAWEAATRVGEGHNDHHIFFGPTNVRIHMVHVEQQVGEIPEALRLADEVDITKIASLERKTAHLYQVARAYECKGNDTAVFVHLKMAERICPEDFL